MRSKRFDASTDEGSDPCRDRRDSQAVGEDPGARGSGEKNREGKPCDRNWRMLVVGSPA